MKYLNWLVGAFLAISLVGCSAVSTAVKKQDLSVESKLSYAVVLEPLAPEQRVVYARIRDVSGNQMRKSMQKALEQNLREEGFAVTTNPKKANLMLNATILSADKTTAAEANALLSQGYKGAAEGALLGAGVTAVTGGSGRNTAAAGLVGAAVGFLADTLIEDVYYTFVMDVQLRERPLDGDEIANSTDNASAKGKASKNSASLSLSKSSVKRGNNYNWIVHETRIVTTANKMNLDINEAIPAVQERTADSLAEMML